MRLISLAISSVSRLRRLSSERSRSRSFLSRASRSNFRLISRSFSSSLFAGGSTGLKRWKTPDNDMNNLMVVNNYLYDDFFSWHKNGGEVSSQLGKAIKVVGSRTRWLTVNKRKLLGFSGKTNGFRQTAKIYPNSSFFLNLLRAGFYRGKWCTLPLIEIDFFAIFQWMFAIFGYFPKIFQLLSTLPSWSKSWMQNPCDPDHRLCLGSNLRILALKKFAAHAKLCLFPITVPSPISWQAPKKASSYRRIRQVMGDGIVWPNWKTQVLVLTFLLLEDSSDFLSDFRFLSVDSGLNCVTLTCSPKKSFPSKSSMTFCASETDNSYEKTFFPFFSEILSFIASGL